MQVQELVLNSKLEWQALVQQHRCVVKSLVLQPDSDKQDSLLKNVVKQHSKVRHNKADLLDYQHLLPDNSNNEVLMRQWLDNNSELRLVH